ncbi:reverse transcriptase domain-containing protein [Tanacetum coccineum]
MAPNDHGADVTSSHPRDIEEPIVTSTFRHPEVPNTSIKLLLFPFSLDGEARDWLDKEPPRSILMWDDLVSKFLNQFFPPSKTTYLRNKITTFYQEPNETFNEAWERFKELLRQCPHHGFSELHHLILFLQSLNTNVQDAFERCGCNFLDKMPREGLAIIKSKSKFREARRSENFVYPVLSELNRTSTLADSGASINLLPHSIYKQLGLEALTPARMTLELANRSVMHPMGIVEDVVVSVDGFTFLADFVVVNFEPDPRVHFILGRPFLRTAKALIDLYEENLTLRIGKEELVYYADKSKKNKDKHFVHAISVIDFSKDDPFSGSTTTHSKWILLLVLLPVKTSDNFEKFADELCSTLICDHRLVCFFAPEDILEIDAFLAIEVSSNFEEGYFDSEGDVTFLDNLLSDDTTHNLASEVISDHEPEQNESSITFSPKSDPLHHEFAGEPLTLPSRNNREFRECLSLVIVLYEISTSQSQENVHQSSVIESLPVSPIPIEDSNPVQEEIDIFRVPDDLIPPGVETDDSEDEDNELPNLDHQDDPSIPRPPPEPPDIEKCLELEAGILIIKVFKDVSKPHNFMTVILPTLPTLVSDLTFILFLPLFLSFGSEDTIFDPTSSRFIIRWHFQWKFLVLLSLRTTKFRDRVELL